jgi:hypothetical protein
VKKKKKINIISLIDAGNGQLKEMAGQVFFL